MKPNKCQVPGCKDVESKRHRFPNPKINMALYRQWIKNVGNEKLTSLPPQQVYKNYYICNTHFEEQHVVPGTKRGLSRPAVPTLHVPGNKSGNPPGSTKKSPPAPAHATGASLELQVPIPELPEPLTELEIPIPGPSVERNMPKPGPSSEHGTVLRKVGFTRSVNLTPRCKVLYSHIQKQAKRLSQSRSKVHNLRRRIFAAEKMAKTHFLTDLGRLNNATTIFIEQQLRNQKLKPKSRRFTLEEKILSLTLLKGSSKGYSLLSKLFSLPSRRTLTRLLNKVPLRPGINSAYFNCLKNMVQKMAKRDKQCVLLFDEIAISPKLTYNRKYDSIDGFQHLGEAQELKIADTANVFMIKGISRQWKQPLAFTFSSGPMRSTALQKSIVEIISECQKIGLKVVATVCDQGAGNVAAIEALKQKCRADSVRAHQEHKKVGFMVNGKEIAPLFDVPHLMKGLRNNLLTKDLHFKNDNGENVVAKWDHIMKLYDLDCSDTTRMLRLTEQHVIPSKINKMKVSLATQIFSYKVGAIMKRLAGSDLANGILPVEAKNTAELILFLDTVFDSLNGNTKFAPRGKPLKGGITTTSGHLEFYTLAAQKFASMKFFCKKKKAFVHVPTLKNFRTTLTNFKYLANQLVGVSVKYLLPRAFNQDPLENFFSLLRSHGVRNTAPDASHFMTSYKSLIVNNFMAKHSPEANCEEDATVGLIDNFASLLTGADIPGVVPLVGEEEEATNIGDIKVTRVKAVDRCIVAYIAGYTARKVIDATDKCEVCSQFLLNDGGKAQYCDLIYARQYKHCHFEIPSAALYNCIGLCLSYVYAIIPKIGHQSHIFQKIKTILLKTIKLKNICSVHNVLDCIANVLVKCVLHNYIKDVNGIIDGKYVKKFRHTKDPIKVNAYIKYNKRRKK